MIFIASLYSIQAIPIHAVQLTHILQQKVLLGKPSADRVFQRRQGLPGDATSVLFDVHDFISLKGHKDHLLGRCSIDPILLLHAVLGFAHFVLRVSHRHLHHLPVHPDGRLLRLNGFEELGRNRARKGLYGRNGIEIQHGAQEILQIVHRQIRKPL